MMRGLLVLVAAGGLTLALGSTARAQDSLGSFGSYPAGITTGSSYGFFPGGYQRGYVGVPTTSGYALAPRTTYYSSGYYGGVPGTVTYGTGVNYSSPNAAYYGYSAPRTYTYPSLPSSRYGTYYVPQTGVYRRGLLGGRSYYRW